MGSDFPEEGYLEQGHTERGRELAGQDRLSKDVLECDWSKELVIQEVADAQNLPDGSFRYSWKRLLFHESEQQQLTDHGHLLQGAVHDFGSIAEGLVTKYGEFGRQCAVSREPREPVDI